MNLFNVTPWKVTDMHSSDGESLVWRVESRASEIAEEISRHIKTTKQFAHLSKLVPSDLACLYFTILVRQEIYATIRTLCVIETAMDEDHSTPQSATLILETRNRLSNLLMQHWPSTKVQLRVDKRLRSRGVQKEIFQHIYTSFRKIAKKTIIPILNIPTSAPPPVMPENSVAVHYAEGVDPNSRSDLFWYRQNIIDAHKILVFFDDPYTESKTAVNNTLKILKDLKVQWVSLKSGKFGMKPMPYWKPKSSESSLLRSFKNTKIASRTHTEKWINDRASSLLSEVDYWTEFYSFFKIKIHIENAEGEPRGIPQRIAMDNVNGVRIGKQRSENLGRHQTMLAFHPNHIFFTWGTASIHDLLQSHNRINKIIISGYPYDYLFENNDLSAELRKTLLDNSANFNIAIFDEMFFNVSTVPALSVAHITGDSWEFRMQIGASVINDIPYSKAMLEEFYIPFLKLVVDNNDVGLIIKSKKAEILPQLPEIQVILEQALRTNRCLIVDNPSKRLPSYASNAADISVGLGISTAICEAAISGAKSFHYDSTNMICHPLYASEHNSFVFNNLGHLIDVIDKYRTMESIDPSIRDFSIVLNELDPFRDGKASERVGNYITDLLVNFENGASQESAIESASSKYSTLWGIDKVMSGNVYTPQFEQHT